MCALRWCGWRVATCKLKGTPFDDPKNLLKEEIRRQAEEDMYMADAKCLGIPCKDAAAARDIPKGGPHPVRSKQYVRGLPGLEKHRPGDFEAATDFPHHAEAVRECRSPLVRKPLRS